MRKVLFIATYPHGAQLREGMAQRIAAIDKDFKNCERIYLCLDEKNKYKKEYIGDNITQFYLNPITHFRLIRKLIHDSDIQYIHSAFNALRFTPYMGACTNLVLDVHGVVPEELKLSNNWFKSEIYNIVERITMKNLKSAVVVSDAMANHLKNKYPLVKEKQFILKTIYPANIDTDTNSDSDDLKKLLGIRNEDVVILYSGNTQKWQNIDLMLKCISEMKNSNYVFIILTQQREEFIEKCKYISKERRLIIESVSPQELGKYYNLAHYGFVLRDDIIVNKVAAPTKIIEYLSYGLTPIVKSPEIGDWKKRGYEYISYATNLNKLVAKKSTHNSEIAKKVYSENQKIDLTKLFL